MPKNPQDDLESVASFMTDSQENLAIATSVYDQYETVRQRILREFFAKLRHRLIKNRSGWWSEYAPPFFTTTYGAFKIAKDSWSGEYEIRIEAYDFGDKMIGGVSRCKEVKGRPYCAPIFEAFKEANWPARQRASYEAEVTIKSPAADWRTAETLWRIKTKPEFLDEVEGMFLSWIKISEPLLDKFVAEIKK